MTKKYHRRRNLKGGLFKSLGQTLGNLGTNITTGATSIWDKTKKMTSDVVSSGTTPSSSYVPPSTSYTPTTSYMSSSSSYGGRRGRSRKSKKGGSPLTLTDRVNQPIDNLSVRANEPINTLASRAAPFSGMTASVNKVGGKRSRATRRKSRKSSRSSRRKTSRR